MIICSNCNHQNPEEALQCENCYSSLPGSVSCPNCGASVQADATFCGQCGFNLQAINLVPETEISEVIGTTLESDRAEPEPVETSMSASITSPWDEEDPTAAQKSDFTESVSQTELMETPAASYNSEEFDFEPEPTTTADNSQRDRDDFEESLNSNMNVKSEPWDFINAPIERTDLETEARSRIEIEPQPVSSTEEPMSQQTPESVSEESIITFSESQSSPSPDFTEPEPFLEPDSQTAEFTVADAEWERDSQSFEEIPPESTVSKNDEANTSPVSRQDTVRPSPLVTVKNLNSNSVSDAQFDSATQLQTQNISLLHVQTNTILKIPQDLDLVHIGKPNSKIPPDIDVSGFADSEVVSRVHADLRVEGDVYFIEDVGSSNGTYVNHVSLIPGNRHRLRAGDRIALGKGDLVTFIFQIA